MASGCPGTLPLDVSESAAPVFQLTLRRTHLVEDTFRQLAAADHCAFKRELLVSTASPLSHYFIFQFIKRAYSAILVSLKFKMCVLLVAGLCEGEFSVK